MDAFPTSESLLKRGNTESCGVMFCLYGPRAVKYSAIWEKDKGRVLFYGPSGKRYQQVKLSDVVIEL
jgi:hypothetical protein